MKVPSLPFIPVALLCMMLRWEESIQLPFTVFHTEMLLAVLRRSANSVSNPTSSFKKLYKKSSRLMHERGQILTSKSISGYFLPLLFPKHLVFPPSSSWHQNPFLGSNLQQRNNNNNKKDEKSMIPKAHLPFCF